ncbi:putative primosome assembly protein PriA [Mycobacterium kansasii]|uniref:Putative primosome assembly protein PriA n=1 Tax=Mycobacterium kansasii TaxID=1768 RepID=A0A1V3WDG0_MYCKA|nr:putative primosome assembly protein PriA [Mycobacterium kansasii]
MVMVVAESSIPTVQSLVRWDPVGHAEAELTARSEVGLPPSVHIAALDGTAEAVMALLDQAGLPDPNASKPSCSAPSSCRPACADRPASPPEHP